MISLRRGLPVEPESFESVTILFSDIVGFAELVVAGQPKDVMTFLADSHGLFDLIIQNFDIYKVETINDAYVVLG